MENKNKPAFSVALKDNGNALHKEAMGLTKREYFAGLAMQGLLSNPKQIDTTNFEWIAKHALGYADELLKELEKQP